MNRQLQRTLVATAWEKIRGHLEDNRHRVREEIKNYPRPVPACDQQFNHLLEERAGISQELAWTAELSMATPEHEDAIRLVEEFIRSSRYMDEEAKQRILCLARGEHCKVDP
jgi:hypothetical protein